MRIRAFEPHWNHCLNHNFLLILDSPELCSPTIFSSKRQWHAPNHLMRKIATTHSFRLKTYFEIFHFFFSFSLPFRRCFFLTILLYICIFVRFAQEKHMQYNKESIVSGCCWCCCSHSQASTYNPYAKQKVSTALNWQEENTVRSIQDRTFAVDALA